MFAAIAGAVCAAAAPAQSGELAIPPLRAAAGPPARAATAEGFAPRGWRVETRLAGDLDGDRRPDLVLLLRGDDPDCRVANPGGLGVDRLDTNPRILMVALAQAAGGYRLAARNGRLIPRNTEPVVADPIEEEGGLTLARGRIALRLGYFASAGGWGMRNSTFRFRMREGRVELIGYDDVQTRRNTGQVRQASLNYLTGKAKITDGRMDSDRERVQWRTLPRKPPWTLGDLPEAWEFEPGV